MGVQASDRRADTEEVTTQEETAMIETVSKVANTVVESLRSQPLALALIVINILFLLAVGWMWHGVGEAVRAERESRNVLLTQIAENCFVRKPDK